MNEIVIDVTPNWWQRNRLIQHVRHFFGWCEGTGMVMGRECYLCYEDACRAVRQQGCLICHGAGIVPHICNYEECDNCDPCECQKTPKPII